MLKISEMASGVNRREEMLSTVKWSDVCEILMWLQLLKSRRVKGFVPSRKGERVWWAGWGVGVCVLCVCMCVVLCVCVCACMRVPVCIHACTCVYVCTQPCEYTSIYACVYM